MFRAANFDGSFGKKKQVALGGKREGRKTAAEQARASRADRAERAGKKAQDVAARVLQRVWRGHVVRQLWYAALRKRWLTELAAARSLSDATRLAGVLTLFGNRKADTAHLFAICELVTMKLVAADGAPPVSLEDAHRLRRFSSAVLSRFDPGVPAVDFLLAYTDAKLWTTEELEAVILHLCDAGVFRYLSSGSVAGDVVGKGRPLVDRMLATRIPATYRQYAMHHLVAESALDHAVVFRSAETFEVLVDALVEDMAAVVKLGDSNEPSIEPSIEPSKAHGGVWLLINLLVLGKNSLGVLRHSSLHSLLRLCVTLVPMIPTVYFRRDDNDDFIGDDDDDDMSEDELGDGSKTAITQHDLALFARWGQLKHLWSSSFVKACLRVLGGAPAASKILASLFNLLVERCKTPFERVNLLNVIAYEPRLVVGLWRIIQEQGGAMAEFQEGRSVDYADFVAQLRLFSSSYSHLLFTQDDSEFFAGAPPEAGGTFTLDEIVHMSGQLKELTAALFLGDALCFSSSQVKGLRGSLCTLLKQLNRRDCTRPFCPPGHWLSDQTGSLQALAAVEVDEFKSGEVEASTRGAYVEKLILILKNLPFLVPFDERARFFQSLITHDATARYNGRIRTEAMGGGNHFVEIRRNRLYGDAFDELSKLRDGLRLQVRVSMINDQGIAEAGIDGGGVFREFLDNVVKEGFSLDRGVFRSTPDQTIFPHPNAPMLHENALQHFEFLGRVLGKAMYQGSLVELPFASFFLSKILGQLPFLNDLASLDPEMHKNLLFLRNYPGDCADLSLDFSIQHDDPALGQGVIDLVPGGRDIAVTNENKIRYIYHVANYRLNIQIRSQCAAFRRGLFDLINQEWLIMFSPQELQILISGKESDIDIDDLRAHTHYSAGYHDKHATIVMFWRVVEGLSSEQRHNLVKFVTSCSRPPLFGFQQLNPTFCIHSAGDLVDRLPTASTCMNLLKLPKYTDELELRDKLVYAIDSGSGFELS